MQLNHIETERFLYICMGYTKPNPRPLGFEIIRYSKTSQELQMLSTVKFVSLSFKCLKGHRSLGSLFECQVVKFLVTQSVTRSPIELFWTAKKWERNISLKTKITMEITIHQDHHKDHLEPCQHAQAQAR